MKNILIVDDNDLVCRLIGKLSQRQDVLITIARNGEEAEKLLKRGLPLDLIFLDLNLPCIDGWDLLTLIRNDPVTKDTPVVILTGLTLSDEEKQKLRGRVTKIIDKKTFNKSAFAKLLKKLL